MKSSSLTDTRIVEYPTDTKYSWFVAALACLVYSVTLGVIRSLGILLVEMQEHYHISDATGMWILASTACMILIAGPSCGVLVTKLAIRSVMMLGFCILCAGLIATLYVPSYHYLFICFFIMGIAMNYMFFSCIVAVTMYFEKQRSTAIGIASAGAGIGTFYMPPLVRLMFDRLSYQQCTYIICAIVIQMCVPAMFIKPLSYWKNKSKELSDDGSDNSLPLDDNANPVQLLLQDDSSLKLSASTRLACSHEHIHLSNNSEVDHNTTLLSASSDGVHSRSPTSKKTNLTIPEQDKTLSLSHDKLSLAASVQNMMLASELDISNLAKKELCDTPEQNNETSGELMSFCSTIRLLFTNQMFLVFLLSNYLMSCGCHIIFAVIPQFGVELQVEKTHIALAFSIGGVLEIVARFANGFLANRRYISAMTQLGGAVVTAGLSLLILVTWRCEAAFYFTGALNGICLAPVVTLIPIVLLERFNKAVVSVALGIVYGVQGCGVITSYGITPYLQTLYGTWDISLYFMIVCMFIGGSIQIAYSLLCPTTTQKYLTCFKRNTEKTTAAAHVS